MREEELKKVSKGRKAATAGGGGGKNSIMNGRALFSYNPDLFTDADGAADATAYEEEDANGGLDKIEEEKVAEDAD